MAKGIYDYADSATVKLQKTDLGKIWMKNIKGPPILMLVLIPAIWIVHKLITLQESSKITKQILDKRESIHRPSNIKKILVDKKLSLV